MYHLLRSNTEKYLQLSDEEFRHFSSCFHPKIYSKKEFLLRQGDICDFEAFIITGSVVGFHEPENGNKAVIYLMTTDWWLTDIGGWVQENPSLISFQALEETKVLYISKEKKQQLYKELPVVERLFRMMWMVTIGALQKRLISNLSMTADERYSYLIDKYPLLEQQVPQYLIASYLGISAEFLCKIRKKVNKIK